MEEGLGFEDKDGGKTLLRFAILRKLTEATSYHSRRLGDLI